MSWSKYGEVRRALDTTSGVVLLGLGARLAAEHV
jgi:threonine/homoserine/homoserine lactone efflux protein